jgi:HEAT repeat protein
MHDQKDSELIKTQLVNLASDVPDIYEAARNWFIRQGPEVTTALIQGLDDDRLGSICHWRILLLLRYFAKEETLAAILKVLQRSLQQRNFTVLSGAMEASAVFHNAEVTRALIELLQDKDPDIVKHAASLLGQNGDRNASKPLIDLLSNADPFVRYSAAKALIQLDGPTAHTALVRHLEHEMDSEIQELIVSSGLGIPNKDGIDKET